MNFVYSATCFSSGTTVYFYNSESNIDNFAILKTTFDSYLSEQGDYQFLPFDKPEKLDEVINKKGAIYLLSNWYLNELLQQKIPLQIALIGSFQGNVTQKKILSVKQGINDFSMLKNTTIAGAGSELYIRSVLQQIDNIKYKEIGSTIKILEVPKDIDALLAVGFGMADAAISAESSLQKLEKINQNQYKQLHALGGSEKSYLLVAATVNKPNLTQAQLLKILYDMPNNEVGLKYLKLLGLDGWQWK